MVPEEVAVWLLERNKRYPQIEFRIQHMDVPGDENLARAEKYSKVWHLVNPLAGIDQVSFLYLNEVWFVRIAGASDGKGNVVEMGGVGEALGPELRAEISGLPLAEMLEDAGGNGAGLPRTSIEPVKARETNLVELKPTE